MVTDNQANATRRLHRHWLAGTVSLLAIGAPVAAHAAEVAAPDAAATEKTASADATNYDEIVVTARHRSENLQTTPVAISVLSGDLLRKTNTNTIEQALTFVPSAQFTTFNPRNSSINIRGLGNNIGLASDGLDPGVGFYVDQVYFNRPGTATFDLIDIERIEVLRGPQGTLYGKNTTAGAVVVTSAKPTFDLHAGGEVSIGNYGYFQGKASVSGPLVADKLALRLSGAVTVRNGTLVNLYNDQKQNDLNNLALRGQLLFTPTSDISVRVIGDYSKQDVACCNQVLSNIVTPSNGKNFVALSKPFGYTPVVDPFARQANTNSPLSAFGETGGVSMAVDWTLSGMTLTSVTAWRFWNWAPQNDLDFTPMSAFTSANNADQQNQFSQELRIASNGTNTIDYVGGLFFFDEKIDQDLVIGYGNAAMSLFVSPFLPALVLNGVTQTTANHYHTQSLAGFGQATWHINDKLNLTGGLRYTYDWKDGIYSATVAGGVPLTGFPPLFSAIRNGFASPGNFNVSVNEGALSGMANLSYQAADNLMVYGTYSRGSRSGGLNLIQLPPGVSPVVATETLNNFEIGLKSQWFDRRLTFNAALFYIEDNDYQAQTYDVDHAVLYLANVPKVTSQGVEIDIQARPFDNLSLYGSLTYDNAKYDSFPTGPCGLENATKPSCDLSNTQLPGVPEWAAAAGGEFDQPLNLGSMPATAYVGVDWSYRSSINTTAANSIYTISGPLNLVNARIGIRAESGIWDAYVWAKNLFDEEYFTTVSPGVGATGALTASLGDPQMYGLTVRFRY
ncbi:TonB-dependent receptor [Polymorphobacter arshaanensis]|uniref:TonB-dependent receptor n=1 Tax=Glacieibacterium arshaanense TaxID=2511025 RepID=A0A4Y9EQE8_9SPHN|nr:TonB-dependent receptor [Polymorphobacter arshaanensis]TFU05837.1 TonB-dependent receptor [Polymorphobacter arshaanensis]